MRNIVQFFTLISIFLLNACTEKPEINAPDYTLKYDIYIQGGTLVDGTGSAPFTGDVLTMGERIAYIGKTDKTKISAATVIDASGKIVTPGFIDAHSHGDPLADNNDFMRSFLRQGVTTIILGQDGSSPNGKLAYARWIKDVGERGSGPNIASLVGHGSLRTISGGGEKDKITPAEQAKMEALLVEALEHGAYGMSTGLEYIPGRYADTQELNGLAKVIGRYDSIISSHIRSEDDDKVEAAIAEVIAQGKYAKVNVTHIKVVYGKTRAQGDAVLEQIRTARAGGMTVTADVYPYLASYGSMIFLYPEWAKRKSEFELAVKTRRPEFEAFLRAKIKRRNGANAILISKGKYAGQTLQDVADKTGKRPEQLIIDFGHSGPSTAHFIMTKETQDAFITAPDISISSDGSPTMRHPRSFGSFPKVIEDYVVRDKLMPIELAIHKMSGLTAQTFGIKSRGVLKPGMAADVLVINLDEIAAGTGWSDINALPSGFDAVIVNGRATETKAGTGSDVYGRLLLKTRGD